MEEVIRRFVAWTRIKIKIHLSDNQIFFREGEIWWVNLGVNVGHEEEGKNDNFERPILVLKKFNRHILWAVPLTTKIKDNPYYFQYEFNNEKFAALLSQLRIMSSKRLIRKIGMISENDFYKIKDAIKRLL